MKANLPTRTESKPGLMEQVNTCLLSGDYSRAVELLRSSTAESGTDTESLELQRLAQDGIKHKAEADRLITESQELFAQQKSAEAIQLLRQAYELDKKNSLARSILANALVEQAHSFVEADWLAAETLTNQALALNQAHPTAKTILNLILDRKKNSSVEDWVSQARKLQSAGDLFSALAWVAEGLAVHPHDPKLLQIQDEIQRDQDARRRQTRRHDLEDLRRMALEIDGAADVAAKQAFGERIQGIAAKYWTDGEILSIANALLLRLGLVPKSSIASPHGKGAAVIFHVPRPSASMSSGADASQIARNPTKANQPAPSTTVPGNLAPKRVSPADSPSAIVLPGKVPPTAVPNSPVPQDKGAQAKVSILPPEPQPLAQQASAESSAAAAKVTSSSSEVEQPARSNLMSLVLVSAAVAIVAVSATLFFTRKHYASSAANGSRAAAIVPPPTASSPNVSSPNAAMSDVSTLHASASAVKQSVLTTPEPSLQSSSNTVPAKVTLPEPSIPNEPPPVRFGNNLGSLLVIVGQDKAKVFLNGKLQHQLTDVGQMRIPNLEPKDYVIQVSKSGFQDSPRQEIRIRKGEQASLIFNLQPQPQPQPRLSSLTIQGGVPGTTVFVDQSIVGVVQADGRLFVSSVNPGDHTVELRKERFQRREFKKHFLVGEAISLVAADASLEAAPGELKINFTPNDAKLAIVKGDRLTTVSSGVPLSLVAGTYTLTARTADGFRSSATLEVVAGQSRVLDLPLAPNGMSKWDDPAAWKHEKDSFIAKGGNFVLYGVVPASGTFAFSVMPARGHLLQWVLDYADPKNYVLFQMDDEFFYRTVIRNGEKADQVKIPEKSDKKSFRVLHVRVSATELVHQIKHGESWIVLDRWTQPGADLSAGKFGFYIPGNDQVALSNFVHYADLNIR